MSGVQFQGQLVEIHGVAESVAPLAAEAETPSKEGLDINGRHGRAVGWSEEEQKYWVQTFDALIFGVREENLKEYEPPKPEDGGFDLLWPFHQNEFFTFCMKLNNVLVSKGWCVVQMNKSDDSRSSAAAKAKKRQFISPKEEFLSDYIGRRGIGKVTPVEPLKLSSISEVRSRGEEELGSDALSLYDLDVSSIFGVLGPMTVDTMGFHSAGRTEAMMWMPYESKREQQSMSPEPLNDDDIEDGLVEKHIQFLKRRMLSFMYMIDNNGGHVWLYPRDDLNLDPVQIPAESSRLLIFRCDSFSFRFQPENNHLTSMTWVLSDAQMLELREYTGDLGMKDELMGLDHGPRRPQGELARVMSIACMTSGGAYDIIKATQLYIAGTDAETYISNSRFDTDIYLTKDGENDLIPYGNSYQVHGSFVTDEDVMGFDPHFFSMTDDEASILWPNQRKVLEVGYEVLQRAGHSKDTLDGAPIVVYLGDCGSEWWHYLYMRMWQGEMSEKRNIDWIGSRNFTITASRLSYTWGLRGPHWLTDTACSSGLTAFCTAMYSMKHADKKQDAPTTDLHADGCVSGGVNMIVDAGVYVANCAQHMLSLKGRCFTFDVGGDGYARGEGCSLTYVVVSNDDKDSDMQEGVAIGNKVNQDGRSASMTAPNGPSQQMCIKASLREAAVDPHDITASECHGTGTSLGDPIEVGSLRGVQETDDRDNGLCCTSSKSNVGHLEANAGTTGLLKNLLMCKYAMCPPNCHMRTLNPHLDAAGWPAFFETEVVDFSMNTGIVGVSSFGVSGTNAHAEVWGECRIGPRQTKPSLAAPDKLDLLTLTCPVTLAPMEHLTGEPATRCKVGDESGDRKKYRADVLRDEFASYDVSTFAYEGGYRFRREDVEEDDENLDAGILVCCCGSWTGWTNMEDMEVQEDGSHLLTMILGETRCESFYIAMNGSPEYEIYPAMNNAHSRIWAYGPDDKRAGRKWLIDGRDDEVPAGTVYQIHFAFGKERLKVWWEEVGPKHAINAVKYDHSYAVVGSWTAWKCDDMVKVDGEDGVWEYSLRIGYTGSEELQIRRDRDETQTIYPASPQAMKSSIPVRGPDDLCTGKNWLIRGPVGEVVKLRLEVDDAQIIVTIVSETKGEKVYQSREGWQRHDYCLAGSWTDMTWETMTMDPELPGVFRCKGVVGQNYSEQYRGFVEFFTISVDEDPNCAFFPEVAFAGSAETMTMGPGPGGRDNPWMVKSLTDGSEFEVVLDLTAADRRKIVTWTWATPQPFGYPILEDGRIGGGAIVYDVEGFSGGPAVGELGDGMI